MVLGVAVRVFVERVHVDVYARVMRCMIVRRRPNRLVYGIVVFCVYV